ncbi:hypothetical protein SISNIDRAFT_549703 [Sistotremastrum niveocremeum HHB9708]|uniref:EF-hand domain-containing protein n=1 Tax=Sistotremastrum niveocremeum HHB9708 TaxID=1314777 RepID=A0A164UKU8_9AGAM|nr:hypothetical protein SISNIDRAFT_549703 [Sistotremastrum niveocremeum HHB9708]
MKLATFVSVAGGIFAVYGHGGDHEDILQKAESTEQYAARHMASEHHIDSFDSASFFQLHDLNRNGFWEREEIEAIYGVHHVYSQKKSKDEEAHQQKADHIVNTILSLMDVNKDGKISLEEFEKAGLDSLPNFNSLGAEGHHYDVESEFFLHHEEIYHATPESQTDDSYTHPEDIEHFAEHEAIEAEEERRERVYQGIREEGEAPSPSHNTSEENVEIPPAVNPDHPHDDQAAFNAQPVKPKIERVVPSEKLDPSVRFAGAREEGEQKPDWGQGPEGYRRPKSPADKMRRNVPYKYKFRRSWGDF